MNTIEKITSAQNPRIKHLQLLQQKSSARRKEGLFVVEGQRELMHCLDAGYELDCVFCCPEIMLADESVVLNRCVANDENVLQRVDVVSHRSNRDVNIEEIISKVSSRVDVSSQLYDKIAYRGGTEGVIAIVKAKSTSLDELHLSQSPLFVVLESVEKPGNLGAILRSADAAGADAVIVCDPYTDLHNPNLIRSSLGAIFTVPCVACTSEECINYLKSKQIQILTAQLQDSSLYYDTPMDVPTAIVMGTESTGLSSRWREAADAHIRIPMLGNLDSLNVSVSAAVLLYEAVRQRS